MRHELNQSYLETIKPRYKKAKKSEKTKLLDHAELVTGLSRKRIIKLLADKSGIKLKPQGRPRLYTYDIAVHLIRLYPLMERVCPIRMKAAIPLWLEFYEAHYGMLDDLTREKLLAVSASTIGRILKENAQKIEAKSSTRVNYKLKKLIPLKTLDEQVTEPGTVQADTVAHCGSALAGDFANTLTMTDVFSGWTENRACWTKGAKEIKKAIARIEDELPFKIKFFDTDCGSEFLNYTVMEYFERSTYRDKKKHKHKVRMRRSRPYKKNDQCYVEQKNYTHVRNLFAYDRLDHFYLIEQMNDIYETCWNPLHNYFLPSSKLEKKVRVGSKVKKVHDKPKTPAQRIIDHPEMRGDIKRMIKMNRAKLDPIDLKENLEKKLSAFYTSLKKLNMSRDAA